MSEMLYSKVREPEGLQTSLDSSTHDPQSAWPLVRNGGICSLAASGGPGLFFNLVPAPPLRVLADPGWISALCVFCVFEGRALSSQSVMYRGMVMVSLASF